MLLSKINNSNSKDYQLILAWIRIYKVHYEIYGKLEELLSEKSKEASSKEPHSPHCYLF